MLCKECKKRKKCKEACEELITHLEGLDHPQHDELIDPQWLDEMLLPGAKIHAEEKEDPPVRLGLRKLVASMEPRKKSIIIKYFWEGKNIRALARDFKTSGFQVKRLLRSSLKELKEMISVQKKMR